MARKPTYLSLALLLALTPQLSQCMLAPIVRAGAQVSARIAQRTPRMRTVLNRKSSTHVDSLESRVAKLEKQITKRSKLKTFLLLATGFAGAETARHSEFYENTREKLADRLLNWIKRKLEENKKRAELRKAQINTTQQVPADLASPTTAKVTTQSNDDHLKKISFFGKKNLPAPSPAPQKTEKKEDPKPTPDPVASTTDARLAAMRKKLP